MDESMKARIKDIFDEVIGNDDIMRTWFKILLTNEIQEVSGTIENQTLAYLGGDPCGEENLKRLVKYKDILLSLDSIISIIV